MVIQGMANLCSEVHVVISVDATEAMYSVEKVREMISGALLNEGLTDVFIQAVEVSEDDGEWLDAVLEVAEGKDGVVIWSGRDDVIELCEANGVETKRVTHVPGIDGEEIRDLITAGDSAWRSKVPGATIDVVTAPGGDRQ
tara:strand:- start:81 stop:503 length:423 start_codon:yes stop_codon:yes gene_type:complete